MNRRDKKLSQRIASLLSSIKSKKDFWALQDICLIINHGDIVGIIGGNGSGKTTLLKILGNIYSSSYGIVTANKSIYVSGSLNNLVRRLTVKENIYLSGLLSNISYQKIKESLNEITTFAELQKFSNTKFNKLSNGMKKKLNFSILLY